jgi:hypothetical protein
MRTLSKITRAKWTRGVVQMVESLLCKHEALNSNSNPTKTPQQQKEQPKSKAIYTLA